MKIIHTADLHLGSPLTSRLPEAKRRARRRELISNFSRLTEEARRLGASAMIIAGDLFDSAAVSEAVRGAFLSAVSAAPDIKFYCLGGNHDGGVIESLGTEAENLFVFGGDAWESFLPEEGVRLVGRTECSVGMFEELDLKKEDKNIVVLHGELRERCAEGAVGIKDARGKNVDYLALGHYHSFSETVIDGRGAAVYSGTPEGRGFDEAGECGFVLIDTDGEALSYSFIPFAARTVRIVKLPLDGIKSYPELERRAAELLSKIPAGDLVRLELIGSYSVGLWRDTEALVRHFSSDFYYFEAKDCSHLLVRAEDFMYDRSLKGEFIRLVLADESLSESLRADIIAVGIDALTSEGGVL